jgi:hypothetical protein
MLAGGPGVGPPGVSGLGGGVDVLQPHLAASHRLAILAAGDHDLPQLLGMALLDRLGNHLNGHGDTKSSGAAPGVTRRRLWQISGNAPPTARARQAPSWLIRLDISTCSAVHGWSDAPD